MAWFKEGAEERGWPNSDYYRGDRAFYKDKSVPNRPTLNHKFNGIEWVEDVAGLKAKIIEKIKTEAGKRIIAIIPEWKQRNLIARSSQLIRKTLEGTITTDETTELDTIESLFDTQVKPIREASDLMEAEVDILTTNDSLLNYDIETNILWP